MKEHPNAGAAGGNEPAAFIDDLARRYGRAVLAVCLANVGNLHDAEDIMQSVFLRAMTTHSTIREPNKARAWLLQIARRLCMDHYRRQAARKRLVPADLPPDVPAPCPDDLAAAERVHAAIARLPAEAREVLALYYLDGRTCRAVAAFLGMSEAAVRQRLFRARLRLHDLLVADKERHP